MKKRINLKIKQDNKAKALMKNDLEKEDPKEAESIIQSNIEEIYDKKFIDGISNTNNNKNSKTT